MTITTSSMVNDRLTAQSVADLQAQIQGSVLTPDDPRYAEARLARSGDPVYKARSAWQTEERDGAFPREDQDPAFVRLHGRALRLADLLGTPRDDERWDDSEQTRLGQLALRVWQPVLTGPQETVTL